MNKPNILMIICDQMVAQLTGAYGHPVVQTPNLNKLAAQGVRFENAYTSCPICSPARQSLLTGKYASNINCYDNTCILGSDQPTLPHYLSIAGYDTVLSGKMHFIGPDQLHGFEKRLTTDVFPSDFLWLAHRPKGDINGFASFHQNPIAIDYVTAGVRQWSMQFDYDEEVHFRALEYLRSKRSQYTGTLQKELPPRDERPFFLCVSYCHPHEPFHATQELWDLYVNAEIDLPKLPENLSALESYMDKTLNAFHGTHQVDLDDREALYNMRRAYYALITYVDRKVGELLQALQDYGLKENTLVLFLSDHGDMLGERRMVQKRAFYDYSARIPWLMALPSMLPQGAVISAPVSITDVMPTVLDTVGFPAQELAPIDGATLLPGINGRAEKTNRVVFSENHVEGVNTTCFMARQGNFKYIQITGHPPQLYNLANDPQEWHNLAGCPDYAEVENKLHIAILEQFNPTAIEHDIQDSLVRRQVIRRAMQSTGHPKWDFQPFFDATKQYWREG